MGQGITVGSNLASLVAQRQLGQAGSKLSKTYERLSSGQRINRAADDAAGLAIAAALNAQAKISGQGLRNLNDGISYAAIAGGAVKELKSILYRQRELATQSANGSYSDQQRAALEVELQQLSAEWNRILDSTSFNGRKVFSAKENAVTLQAGMGSNAVLSAAFGSKQAAAQDDMARVAITSSGTQANGPSDYWYSMSANGRYVAFDSAARNLVPGDSYAVYEIFVKDLQTGEIKRALTDANGGDISGGAMMASLSPDGRFLAFTSSATDLVAGDTNGQTDLFIRDLETGETKRINTSSSGAQTTAGSNELPGISADNRYVVFHSTSTNLVAGDANGFRDVFIKDVQTGETRLVSTSSSGVQGNGSSGWASLSGNGRYVLFESNATNLVAGDSNGVADLFVKDLQSGEVRLVSTSSTGTQANFGSSGNSISADGRYVTFHSSASNLVSGDTNGTNDIFVKDLQTGETRRISTSMAGVEGNASSTGATISADGRYVAFGSGATNLLPGDTLPDDVFIKDLKTGELVTVSRRVNGAPGDNSSYGPRISSDGRYVVFGSYATNLMAGDTNGQPEQYFAANPLVEWSTVSRNQWLSVSTRQRALSAQSALDAYLEELNSVEGTLGAIGSRVGTALNNLQSMTENFRSAEARIMDADIADEAADLARTQILQQAATAILAQANQAPALALTLIR